MSDHNWTGGDLPTVVGHLEYRLTGERNPAGTLHSLSRADAAAMRSVAEAVL